jgi:quercetin dioxygenase-like cupin family protein
VNDSGFSQPFPTGEPNEAFAQYFSGRSWNAPIVGGDTPVNNITFEPGCRNDWHIHHGEDGGGDQVLLCTAGSGWYQADGSDPISLTPGTAVRVPAGTKHWHGAKVDSWFSHLAFITPGEGVRNEWLEAVSDELYDALPKDGDPAGGHARTPPGC